MIGREHDIQRQIDRACSAQNPKMLPQPTGSTSKIEAAKDRIKKQKSQYSKPAS